MPEARFEDIIVIKNPRFDRLITLDAKLVEFCIADSIVVCGIACSEPTMIGARIYGDKLKLTCSRNLPKGAEVYVRVSGIRKDQPIRWPEFTAEQAERNNAFWRKATRG